MAKTVTEGLVAVELIEPVIQAGTDWPVGAVISVRPDQAKRLQEQGTAKPATAEIVKTKKEETPNGN